MKKKFKLWAERWDELVLYTFTEATLKEIAEQKGISKQAVHVKMKRTVAQLRELVSVELNQKYEDEVLSFQKPLTIQSRMNISKSAGGIMEHVLPLASAGMSPADISRATGYDINTIYNTISTIRKNTNAYGLDLPLSFRGIKKVLSVLSDSTSTQEERQQILGQISHPEDLYRYPEIVRISELLKEANISIGRNKSTPLSPIHHIVQILKDIGIPASVIERKIGKGMQRYGIIAATDREKALEALLSRAEFAAYRKPIISELTGKEISMPKTTNILNNKEFVGVRSTISQELLSKIRHNGLRIEDLFDKNCPAPIFKYETYQQIFCRVGDVESVSIYLDRRIEELMPSIQQDSSEK